MLKFAASGVYIEMSPWALPFKMMGRQGYAVALKISLSWGRLKCNKGRMMRTCLSWIQPHPHVAILWHLLNMVNSFLCSSTNYFENWLLPNDFIIVRCWNLATHEKFQSFLWLLVLYHLASLWWCTPTEIGVLLPMVEEDNIFACSNVWHVTCDALLQSSVAACHVVFWHIKYLQIWIDCDLIKSWLTY
jgi:hypothetical protein